MPEGTSGQTGYVFTGTFPRDENGRQVAVLAGVVEDGTTFYPGMTDTYIMASFTSDGKLQVDTELTLSIENLTITNVLVAATDQTGTHQRYIKTDNEGRIELADIGGIDVDLSYANDSVQSYGWDSDGLTHRPIRVDGDGNVRVSHVDGLCIWRRRVTEESGRTGVSAIDFTTGLTHDFRIDHVRVHFNAATSNGITITCMDKDDSAYDTILQTSTLNSDTDYLWIPDADLTFMSGNEIKVEYVNSGSALYGVKIVTEDTELAQG